MDAVTKLRDALLEHELITARERDKVSIALYLGDVRRHRSKLSRRFTISIGGAIRFVAKFIPSTWSYKPEDILATIDAYSRCAVFSVPKLLAHFRSNDGYYFIEEYLKDPVSLADLIERGEMSPRQGLELLRKVFTEIAQTGTLASPEFLWSEQKKTTEYLEYFIERGIVGDAILNYIGRTIEKHSGSLKEVWSSGDIIDRNLLHSEGKWYLTDYEYSHRTIFLFKEAYRNIQYCPWAKDIALHEIFLPLGQFPEDVARIIALAWDNHLQRDLLDTVAREQTSGHLRHLFWNVIDPALLERLDKKLNEKVQEATHLAATVEEQRARLEALQEGSRQVHASLAGKEEYIALLEANIASHLAELSALNNEIARQKQVIDASEERVADALRQLTDKVEQIKQLQSSLLQFQRTVEEKTREIGLLQGSLQAEQLDARRKEEDHQREVRKLQDTADRARSDLEQTRLDLDGKLSASAARVQELVNYSESLQHQLRVKEESLAAKATHISELERQVAQKSAEVQQKIAEYIYIKSTLSYSIGRIITLPFAFLFDGLMKLVSAVDKSSGHVLWPKGTRRSMLVNALMNLRQTIATGTYLLRMHGPGGLWNGFRQTWGAGVNLALHRTFTSSAAPVPVSPKQKIQPLLREKLHDTGVGVSVVIPTLNEEEMLVKLLPTLKNQQGFSSLEIIVVDSGSTDSTVWLAREYGAKVVEIPSSEFSHSGARNLGAKHATKEFLLLMTADALPVSDRWLYQMYDFMVKNKAAAVSCVEVPRNDADLFARVENWVHYRYILGVDGGDRISSKPPASDPASLRRNAQLSDVACLMRRETFLKYGFRKEYAEDLDLGIRLLNDGASIGLLNSTKVIHSHTRPSYYYLKRGYVDKKVIAEILGEPAGAVVKSDALLADIFETYAILASLHLDVLPGYREPAPLSDFVKAFQTQLALSCKSPASTNGSVPEGMFDQQTILFLSNLKKLYKVKPGSRSSGEMMKEMQEWLGGVFEYMRMTYDFVDTDLIHDFRKLLGQLYANFVGRALAGYYLISSNEDRNLIAPIHAELFDGRIMWEEKGDSKSQDSKKMQESFI